MHQPHRGFSLIECSIAVAALAVALSMVIPPPISRRQKWNFLVSFLEEVP
ncbi:prepilin-type N-terminal cleavage/methylation domain-containing protein [Xanthomonas phaseoli]|nr:prepilin-type N-terminal cleavage/methylation domain-containing protein [Xanthomonas phaseoli]